ncbi:MAG: MbnB/TglH/ChrH family RiPP precursor modification enzyme, partial [Acidiferrobacter sp.]
MGSLASTHGNRLPAAAEIGLRGAYVRQILAERPSVAWLEIHKENIFADDEFPVASLLRLREQYPLSLHGVGLSLGSTGPLDERHLRQLERAIERFASAVVSDHVCWTSIRGRYLRDLLSLPPTRGALRCIMSRISAVQDRFDRPILVENAVSYPEPEEADYTERDLTVAIIREVDCRFLLDVNNVYLNSANHGFGPYGYIETIPHDLVDDIHLASFTEEIVAGRDRCRRPGRAVPGSVLKSSFGIADEHSSLQRNMGHHPAGIQKGGRWLNPTSGRTRCGVRARIATALPPIHHIHKENSHHDQTKSPGLSQWAHEDVGHPSVG